MDELNNNNNYLPGFHNQMSAAGVVQSGTPALVHPQGHHIHIPQNFHNGGLTGQPNGFTFTSPTQCITSATPRGSIQTACPMNMSAPGTGASWQHTIPHTMSWIPTSAPLPTRGLGNASQFTGQNSPLSFIPSCSTQIKRPKRKAGSELSGGPSSKVHLCLDKFQKLHISPRKHNADTPSEEFSHSQNSSWKHFHEVEKRLDEELEDLDLDLDLNLTSSSHNQGSVLKVADGILEIDQSKPLLPRKVIEEVQRPCMQLVVWQSPGAAIRGVLDSSLSSSTPPPPPSCGSTTHSSSGSSQLTSKIHSRTSSRAPSHSNMAADAMEVNASSRADISKDNSTTTQHPSFPQPSSGPDSFLCSRDAVPPVAHQGQLESVCGRSVSNMYSNNDHRLPYLCNEPDDQEMQS